MTRRTIDPLGNNVVVEILRLPAQKSGLLLPDYVRDKKECNGIVKAVGPGRRSKKGVLIPCALDVGHRVILPRLVGTNVEIDGKLFAVVDESDILGVYTT